MKGPLAAALSPAIPPSNACALPASLPRRRRLRGAGAGRGGPRGGYGGAVLPARHSGPAMWCLHCSSERTQSLLELELDSW